MLVGCFLLPFLGLAVSFTHYLWSSFIVSCWLSQFIDKCEAGDWCTISKVEELLATYADMETSLGCYLVYTFSTSQVNWISQLYLGVASLSSPYSPLSRSLYAVGSFSAALGGDTFSLESFKKKYLFPALIFLKSFSGMVEDTFVSLKKLSSGLETELVTETDCNRISRLNQLIRCLDRVKPISANGLFREVHGTFL